MKSTKISILENAELLIRTKGYSDFSYSDLSKKVGITKASIHHHFQSKEILGIFLLSEYTAYFSKKLKSINENKNGSREKLLAYSDLFTHSQEDGLLPLCCVMAVERAILPKALQDLSRELFIIQLDWIKEVLSELKLPKTKKSNPQISSIAITLLSTLEGSSIISWILEDDGESISTAYLTILNQYLPK